MKSSTEAQPAVAYLRQMIPGHEGPVLHQAKITDQVCYESFAEFAEDFWTMASYPSPQARKFETYSFSPTLYEPSLWIPRSKPEAKPKDGIWRVGEAAADDVTVAYFDLDNHHDARAMIGLDDVEEILRSVGWSYLLYTSFSHRPEKHKVRIIAPVDRHLTWSEMHAVFARVNSWFDYQLDGSIYDPGDHLYGPTFAGERREFLAGGSLPVDDILALDLSDEAEGYAQGAGGGGVVTRRVWSDEEIADYKARVADERIAVDVSVDNPRVVNPDWLRLIDECYKGGSHRQSLLGVMSKIWLKSKGELSFGDMRVLQRDLDLRWGFYCERNYGRSALESDLRSVMTMAATQSREDYIRQAVERNSRRFSRKI